MIKEIFTGGIVELPNTSYSGLEDTEYHKQVHCRYVHDENYHKINCKGTDYKI